ncbi:MAG: tetratricopeptide repeat protein, partial [Phycisphaerales bacterium]
MNTRPTPSALRAFALLAAAGAAFAPAASCSRTPREARPSASAGTTDTTTRPDTRAMNAPAPPGLDPALTQLVADDDPKARMPLDEALAVLRRPSAPAAGAAPAAPNKPGVPPSPPAPAASPDPAKQAEALRLYAQGRVARLTNQTREAIAALQAAARLDPASAQIWRELGDAQLTSGNRVFAAAAFSKALDIDPDDERSLEQTSAIAVERRDYPTAAERAARLLARDLNRIDPALPYVTWSRFARSAAALGYTRASAEAAMRAVDLPERFTGPTTRENDLNALYRTRGDTIRDAADALLRLGRFEDARKAYDKAAGLPTLAPSALTPRRVYAAMKLGDSTGPTGAVAIVLDQLKAARGRPDDTLFALISHVAEHTSSGAPALLRGIDAVDAALPEPDRRLAAGALVRSRAAASPRPAAVALLRERLASAPWDEDAMRTLLSRLRADPESAIVSECLALVEAAPLQERRHGTALARELAARRAREPRSDAASDANASGTPTASSAPTPTPAPTPPPPPP